MVEAMGGLKVSSQEQNCRDSYLLEVGERRKRVGQENAVLQCGKEQESVTTSQQDPILQKKMSVFQCH